jgi:hypothetical protein
VLGQVVGGQPAAWAWTAGRGQLAAWTWAPGRGPPARAGAEAWPCRSVAFQRWTWRRPCGLQREPR